MAEPEDKLITVEDQIRHILIREWDPFCLRAPIAENGVYERFIAPLREMLAKRPSQQDLVDYLCRAKTNDLGILPISRATEKEVARELLAIRF